MRRPAIGKGGGPWWGERETEEPVDLDEHIPRLYEDTRYATDLKGSGLAITQVPAGGAPRLKEPVWTWEVPVYFWFGGIAAGASFVALACDLSGDHGTAARARKVSLAALLPCPPLLISDLGRPERFLNMLRMFKPRSPMSMGVWALTAFGNLVAAAVGADLLGRRRTAQALGGATALVGGYVGSYTGVLLAATAVPLWSRSRLFLGPIFVATATATGAAAVRLVAHGAPDTTKRALATVETGAMAAELGLSAINERRLGDLAAPLKADPRYRAAKWGVRGGLALRAFGRRGDLAAGLAFLAAGLAFRLAWVEAGKASVKHAPPAAP